MEYQKISAKSECLDAFEDDTDGTSWVTMIMIAWVTMCMNRVTGKTISTLRGGTNFDSSEARWRPQYLGCTGD